LDLFTFLKMKSPIKMRICGIPCSVSASGLIGPKGTDLFSAITEKEKGLKLFLNLENLPAVNMPSGFTLPTIVMDLPFSSKEEYEKAMLYEYRRRYKKARNLFNEIDVVRSGCSCFGEHEHRLYLEVLKRSSGKLETLTMDFFANLPEVFQLARFYREGELLGWHITVLHQKTQYFFLGGINYRCNDRYETYFNMLYDIIEQGIENKAACADLGQTAEEPKLRTGGTVTSRYMAAHHSSIIFRSVLKLAKGFLEYRGEFSQHHVFKGEMDNDTDMR
ncbi:MAG TPA: GNAT family N-acetyltransferase, partial [Clostridia bacterium]|nr:GNAT family N-acetyltransferase [Clostridia bacterium]